MRHLIECIEQTPHVRRLSVTFGQAFDRYYRGEDNDYDYLRAMISKLRPLNKLNHLSFSTKQTSMHENNEYLPFEEIQRFIDQCCSDKKILKRIIMEFYRIKFNKNMWSTIELYRNTFDRFDFYGLVAADNEIIEKIQLSLNDKHFDYHTEENTSSICSDCYIHIYTLPFCFEKLHGFESCSKLSSRLSFSSVRHLYFNESYGSHLISFESLTKRMPNLVSINCNLHIHHEYNISTQEIIVDEDIFCHVRFLSFEMRGNHKSCTCQKLLRHLLDRMPYLECLKTSEVDFLSENHSFPSIKRFIRPGCDLQLIDPLARGLPHLTILSLSGLPVYPKQISNVVGPLFIRLPLLKSISFSYGSFCGNDHTPYRKYIEEALILIQNMSDSLCHVKLNEIYRGARFYR
ncbi:hypothetical protein I4U23_015950 [Adineta vaga]|nr:hypothetical protein I4U23_015950 [Adineta vaga]